MSLQWSLLLTLQVNFTKPRNPKHRQLCRSVTDVQWLKFPTACLRTSNLPKHGCLEVKRQMEKVWGEEKGKRQTRMRMHRLPGSNRDRVCSGSTGQHDKFSMIQTLGCWNSVIFKFCLINSYQVKTTESSRAMTFTLTSSSGVSVLCNTMMVGPQSHKTHSFN